MIGRVVAADGGVGAGQARQQPHCSAAIVLDGLGGIFKSEVIVADALNDWTSTIGMSRSSSSRESSSARAACGQPEE
jgi:hypothetical protein